MHALFEGRLCQTLSCAVFKLPNPFGLRFRPRISKKKSKPQQIMTILLLIILQKFEFVARQGWGTWQFPLLLL